MARKSVKAKERLDKVRFEAEAQIKRMQEAAKKRAVELQKQIEEAEAAAQKAMEEEQALFEQTEKEIKDLCTERGYYCGVILTKENVLQIVQMAIEIKDNIKIPFRLYVDESEKQVEEKPEKKA